jgi:HrpA-like RNA helicase
MGEEVGGFVDYMASAGKRVNEDAKIIFKLDRLVLDELTEDPVLSRYSCLIIDEAHERTISIDVILGLVK